MQNEIQIGRRAFIKNGSLILSTGLAGNSLLSGFESINRFVECPTESSESKVLKVGLVTDLHYADKPAGGSRHYRDTPKKLAAAAEQFGKSKPDFIVELGDFIDAAESVKVELGYLKRINRDFSAICKQRHYVLGNHCVHTLTKQEFLDGVEQEKSYRSFDAGDFHFVILDSCFRTDGKPYGRKNFVWTDANIPAAELEWLKADLKENKKPTIVFAHQRLDVSNNHGVKNCAEVRKVLEDSKQVVAVFQGHSHKNDHKEIGGIHYCTLVAMVEGAGEKNNGFSVMSILENGAISIDGFVKQEDYAW